LNPGLPAVECIIIIIIMIFNKKLTHAT